jgi:hypothetical protein
MRSLLEDVQLLPSRCFLEAQWPAKRARAKVLGSSLARWCEVYKDNFCHVDVLSRVRGNLREPCEF